MLKRIFFAICILMLSLPALAYDVQLTVPLYGQENNIYGGPACAQMILNSYPPPGTPMYFTQATIWASIQNHNSGEAGWATDPQGMQGALLDLNPPPAGTWALKVYDVKEDLMFQILYWMNYNSYAVTTLVNSGYHWVDVVGYETDIEPTWGSNPVLQEITINNPWPIGQGQTETMSGTVWYSTYWANPVDKAGTWYDKYVAVIEPPEAEGSSSFNPSDRRGIEEISSEAALLFAENWISQLDLAEKNASYSILDSNDKANFTPLLVREGLGFGKTEKDVPYYYIVPYYVKNTTTKLSSEIEAEGIKACVLVNAFSGAYEEVASFHAPIKYIYEQEALDIATKELKVESKVLRASLVYESCALSQSRVCPFWEIINTETREIAYVDQQGKVSFRPYSTTYGR